MVGKILLVFALLAVGVVLFAFYRNLSTPSGLGHVNGRLADLPSSPNAVSSQTEDTDRHVSALPFTGSLSESRERLLAILEADDAISIVTVDETYIHAIASTPLLRFRDDLEFYFDEESLLVHVRSASRVGRSDLGVNRKRYERLSGLYWSKE